MVKVKVVVIVGEDEMEMILGNHVDTRADNFGTDLRRLCH